MDRGSLLVKTIGIATRFARRLFQGSMFCTTVIVIFLIIIVLFDIIFRVKRQKLDFLSFADYSSLLRMCRWTKMYCGRAELGVSC